MREMKRLKIGKLVSDYTSTNPYIKSKTDLNLLTDKGVYPYDYMNSWDKFDETKLPKKEDFYSQLYEENINLHHT